MKRIYLLVFLLLSSSLYSQNRYTNTNSGQTAQDSSGWQRNGTTVELVSKGDIVYIISGTDTLALNPNADTATPFMEAAKSWPSANSGQLMATFTAYKDQPRFVLRRAQGSVGSPSAVTSGTSIGALQFRAYDGTDFSVMVTGLIGQASENFTASAHGSRLLFYTTPNETTTLTENMRIENDGGVYAYNLLQQTAAGLVVEYDTSTKELYAETSTARMKENIADMEMNSGGLFKLKVKEWTDKESGRQSFGLLAEDVAAEFPKLVVYDENNKPLGIKQTKLIYVLFDKIKKLEQKLQEKQD